MTLGFHGCQPAKSWNRSAQYSDPALVLGGRQPVPGTSAAPNGFSRGASFRHVNRRSRLSLHFKMAFVNRFLPPFGR
jgi:hypothetical protein